jgi:hypothetical protein
MNFLLHLPNKYCSIMAGKSQAGIKGKREQGSRGQGVIANCKLQMAN